MATLDDGGEGADDTGLYLGDITSAITKQDILAFFQPYGEILDVTLRLKQSSGKRQGFGFVYFRYPYSVSSYLRDNVKCVIKGITIRVSRAIRNKNIFISGIPLSASNEEIEVFLSRFGPINRFERKAPDPNVYIEFPTRKMAGDVLGEIKMCTFQGLPLTVQWADSDTIPNCVHINFDPILATRLKDTFNEDSVRQTFEAYGKVTRVELPRMESGEFQPFGYVVYTNDGTGIENARRAIEGMSSETTTIRGVVIQASRHTNKQKYPEAQPPPQFSKFATVPDDALLPPPSSLNIKFPPINFPQTLIAPPPQLHSVESLLSKILQLSKQDKLQVFRQLGTDLISDDKSLFPQDLLTQLELFLSTPLTNPLFIPEPTPTIPPVSSFNLKAAAFVPGAKSKLLKHNSNQQLTSPAIPIATHPHSPPPTSHPALTSPHLPPHHITFPLPPDTTTHSHKNPPFFKQKSVPQINSQSLFGQPPIDEAYIPTPSPNTTVTHSPTTSFFHDFGSSFHSDVLSMSSVDDEPTRQNPHTRTTSSSIVSEFKESGDILLQDTRSFAYFGTSNRRNESLGASHSTFQSMGSPSEEDYDKVDITSDWDLWNRRDSAGFGSGPMGWVEESIARSDLTNVQFKILKYNMAEKKNQRGLRPSRWPVPTAPMGSFLRGSREAATQTETGSEEANVLVLGSRPPSQHFETPSQPVSPFGTSKPRQPSLSSVMSNEGSVVSHSTVQTTDSHSTSSQSTQILNSSSPSSIDQTARPFSQLLEGWHQKTTPVSAK
ncbi:hypothetical protein BLNAU_15428 [Blattamonas nauphoetae]|uniref:RRM domain-containing protein n=1 Tax=Blattamonas nauphoetae TaxID=2049346 RepID=A0ABQ9XGA9_9EUKA|nr:hypothetical protein BLNAU_15428 [Blattamonas nauphoetae]